MTAVLAAVVVAACLPLCIGGAGAAGVCGDALGATRTLEGANYTVAYKSAPDPIVVGAHFAIDFAVCPRATAAAAAPVSVRVDATMPEHRHGMNYRPVVTTRAATVYHAEGLLFHMPGRWDLTFDVDANGRTERITGVLRIE